MASVSATTPPPLPPLDVRRVPEELLHAFPVAPPGTSAVQGATERAASTNAVTDAPEPVTMAAAGRKGDSRHPWFNRPFEVIQDLLVGVVDLRYVTWRCYSKVLCCCSKRSRSDADQNRGMDLSWFCIGLVLVLLMILAVFGACISVVGMCHQLIIVRVLRLLSRCISCLQSVWANCWNGFEVTAHTLTVEGALVSSVGTDSVIRVVFKETYDPRADSFRFVKAQALTCTWESGQRNLPQQSLAVSHRVSKSKNLDALQITYSTKTSGAYMLSVRFFNMEIDGSPFMVVVQPGPTDPSECQVYMASYQPLSHPLRVFILIRDKYGNEKLTVEDDRNSFFALVRCQATGQKWSEKLHMTMGAKNGKTGLAADVTLPGAGRGMYDVSIYYGEGEEGGVALSGNPHQVYMCGDKECDELQSVMVAGHATIQGTMVLQSSQIPRGWKHSRGVGLFKNFAGKVDREVPVNLFVNDQIVTIRLATDNLSSRAPVICSTRVTPMLTATASSTGMDLYSPDLPSQLSIRTKGDGGKAVSTLRAFIHAQPFEVSFLERVEVVRSILAGVTRTHRNFFKIRRDHILEDSYHKIGRLTTFQMRAMMRIEFVDEPGIDMGGVLAEWYLVLMREICKPETGLFIEMEETGCFMPNPRSGVIRKDDKSLLYFAGRLVAKAIHEGLHMDVHFTRAMYKLMLRRPITQYDLEADDPLLYRSGVRYIVENDITDAGLELTFTTAETTASGKPKTAALKMGGGMIAVNERNKHEYLELLVQHKLYKRSKAQMDAFLKGFHSLLPASVLRILSPQDLELVLCGLPSFDVNDLKEHTVYRGFGDNDQSVPWFWEIVQEYSDEMRGKLLQFVTGTSKIPLAGIKSLKPSFALHNVGPPGGRLPTGHTCFNQLHLPKYSSKEEMKSFLTTAITEGNEFFGLS